MTRGVFEHFDAEATAYARRSGGWLWGPLRRREAKAVLTMLDPKPGERILDAGCGAGHYAALIRERGADVTGVDGAPAMVEAARARGIEAHVCDLRYDRPPGAPYDKILCAGVLEFCPQANMLLAALITSLRPDGGSLVLMLPRSSPLALLYRIHHAAKGLPCILRSRRRVERWQGLGVELSQLGRVGFNWVAKFVRSPELNVAPALALVRRHDAATYEECPVWVEAHTPLGSGLLHPTEFPSAERLVRAPEMAWVFVRCRVMLATGEILWGRAEILPDSEDRFELKSVISFVGERDQWSLPASGPLSEEIWKDSSWFRGESPLAQRSLESMCPFEVTVQEQAPELAAKAPWVERCLSCRWRVQRNGNEFAATEIKDVV